MNDTKNTPVRNFVHKSLFPVLLFCGIFIASSCYAQDPAQYGTPFTGVPDVRDVNMYQVNIRAFSATHNLAGVTARLDSIKALGINVIYLMPVQPVGTLLSVNSPYCIRNLDSVGSEYGTLVDLRQLVDSAHGRNMAVILDFVANQTSWDHPWITEHPGWYLHDASGAIEALGSYTDVAAVNFSNDSLCKAMDSAMRFWVFTANVDGFRCDFADNPPVSFWTSTIANLRTITTHNLLLLAEGVRSANYTAGFNYNFGYQCYNGSYKPIYASASAVLDIDNSNTVEYAGVTSSSNQIVRFLTNHDVNSSDGTPLELFGGHAGSMALFVTTAYMKGVPFIYNGQEVDFPTQIVFPFTSVTINWASSYTAEAEYKKIIAFRNSSIAIRRGTLISYDNNNVCAFTKVSGTEKVLVLSNLRNSTQTFTMPTALAGISWYDAFTGAAVTLGTSVSLTAYQYRVLTTTVAAASAGPMVTTSPSPVVDDTGPVVIHFHPYWDTLAGTAGDASLRSFGGTIFLYTGLYTNPSTGGWNHTNPTWAANSSYYAMTKVDSNDYSYNIADLRSFYGVGADTLIDTINVIFKDSLGSMQASTIYIPVHQKSTTGVNIVNNMVSVLSLELSPNPANEQVVATVSLGKNTSGVLNIIDQSGRCVQTQTVTSKNGAVVLALRSMAPGIYYISLYSGGQKVSRKLIRQ
jgi:glycosidase